MLKTNEITMRDPYILPYNGKYYLYGTRSHTCWKNADGFDCYVSEDLKNWSGPIEIFHRPKGFFATEKYWAPECYFFQGAFYLICTFASNDRKTGIYVLKSSHPEGPFLVHSECLTPENWACIDGTLYIEDGTPYLVYSHTFEDVPEGEYWAVPLNNDLNFCIGEHIKLFCGTDAKWAIPIPFAEMLTGSKKIIYLTDGPCVVPLLNGKLGISWSSYGNSGYSVGLAVSESGKIHGPWKQLDSPIYQADGGHGMFFQAFTDETLFVMHSPDTHFEEHPIFKKVIKEDNNIKLQDFEI